MFQVGGFWTCSINKQTIFCLDQVTHLRKESQRLLDVKSIYGGIKQMCIKKNTQKTNNIGSWIKVTIYERRNCIFSVDQLT